MVYVFLFGHIFLTCRSSMVQPLINDQNTNTDNCIGDRNESPCPYDTTASYLTYLRFSPSVTQMLHAKHIKIISHR
jgi:hypothetical protein